MDEAELKHRVNEADSTFQTKGWGYIEAEWFVEREKIIRQGAQATAEGKTEAAAYLMAQLAGFDRALKVPEIFKQRFQDFLDSAKEERESKEQTNA